VALADLDQGPWLVAVIVDGFPQADRRRHRRDTEFGMQQRDKDDRQPCPHPRILTNPGARPVQNPRLCVRACAGRGIAWRGRLGYNGQLVCSAHFFS